MPKYKTEVEDLTLIADTFPGLPEPFISRGFLVDTIEELLDDHEVVFLTGREGIGHSTLMAETAERHAHDAMSTFIRPVSSYSYDPEIIRRDLCNQLCWLLGDTETQQSLEQNESGIDTQALLNIQCQQLSRKRGKSDKYYLLVDGLEAIPDEDRHIRDLILDMLPFGSRGISMLLSGQPLMLPKHKRKLLKYKEWTVPKVAKGFTRQYLQDFVSNPQVIQEIHYSCQGIPGYLASIRRLLEKGISPNIILDVKGEIADFFQLEWQDVTSELQKKVLALLAHNSLQLSVNEAARIVGAGSDEVRDSLGKLSFIGNISNDKEPVEFVSDAFRRYTKRQLQGWKSQAQDWVIDDLLLDPESGRSLVHLPDQLYKSGRLQELLRYLSPDKIYQLVAHTQSFVLVERVTDLGVDAALEQNQLGELTRFSLHKSAVTELGKLDVRNSEVEALTALQHYEQAIALAQRSVAKSDRLHQLAIIARKQKEQNKRADPDLIDLIGRLCEEVDGNEVRDHASEIASELLFVNPELAFRLIEESAEVGSGKHSLDLAYLKLSLSAAVDAYRSDNEQDNADLIDTIREKIEDPQAKNMSAAASLLLGDYSASEVIREVNRLEKTGDKLYLLRKWTQANTKAQDAGRVIDYALKIVLTDQQYAQHAGLLRELAEPLPFIGDEQKLADLIDTLDQQLEAISDLVDEVIQLTIILAKAEYRLNNDRAKDRMISLFFDLTELEDLATRSAGMAQIVVALPLGKEADNTGVLDEALNDLRETVDTLLSNTASQFDATVRAIRALSETKPEEAIKLARSLNTEDRRDKALVAVVDSALRPDKRDISPDLVHKAISLIQSTEHRNRLVFKLFRSKNAASKLRRFSSLIGDVHDARIRCIACYGAFKNVTEKNLDDRALAEELREVLKESFNLLEDDWEKIAIGFDIVTALTAYDRDLAEDFREKTEDVREKLVLSTRKASDSYIVCLRLAIRAFSGLLPQHLDAEHDLLDLEQRINRIPSAEERAVLWSELAYRFHEAERYGDAKAIAENELWPIYLSLTEENSDHKDRIFKIIAPALYVAHPSRTHSTMTGLSPRVTDSVIRNICITLLRGKYHTEPFDDPADQYRYLKPENVYQILDLLEAAEIDSMIYHFLEGIVDAIKSDKRQRNYDKNFRRDVARRMEALVEEKLPSDNFIQHDGYAIICTGQIIRLRDTLSRTDKEGWLDLLEQGRQISNVADRVFVLCTIVKAMPSALQIRGRERRRKVLVEVEGLISKIPTVPDRLNRLETMANVALEIGDEATAKRLYRRAFMFTVDVDEGGLRDKRNGLLSAAHGIDPEFAHSLANLVDDDPAHELRTERVRAQRCLRRLSLKDEVIEPDSERVDHDPELPHACWQALGSINARRVGPPSRERAEMLLRSAKSFPLTEAYPIYAFVIQGLTIQYHDKPQANKILRPIYEAFNKSAHLVERVTARSERRHGQPPHEVAGHSGWIYVRAGERAKGIGFIKNWVANNASNRVIICDPYFGPSDVEAINLIKTHTNGCDIEILSSIHHHSRERIDNLRQAYAEAWSARYDDKLPRLRIVVVGKKTNGKSPIHDRYWFTEDAGLWMGTSFNGVGITQDSKIREMEQEEFYNDLKEVEQYLTLRRHKHSKDELKYDMAFIE